MAIPKVQRIHAVGNQHIQVFNPLLFIIKPGETFRRIRIFVHTMPRKVCHLLQSYTCTTQYHFRTVFQFLREVQLTIRIIHTVNQFTASVNDTTPIPAGHFGQIARRRNMKTFFLERRVIYFRQQNRFDFGIGECRVSLLHHYLITGFIQGSL